MCTKFEEEEVKEKTLKELRENKKISSRLYNALVVGHRHWLCEQNGCAFKYYDEKDRPFYIYYYNVLNRERESGTAVGFEKDICDYTPRELYDLMGEAYIMKIRNFGKKSMAELKSLI